MSRIVISLSGEGRGHAARTLSLLQMLSDHEVLVLTPGKLFEWLHESTAEYSNVTLAYLPSLNFAYYPNGKLSYLRSLLGSVPLVLRLATHLKHLQKLLMEFQPDLAIADFEPLLPRAARSLQIPLLSLDHQHFLAAIDTSILPKPLARRTLFLRPSVKLFCPSADHHLVSSFYQYPQRPGTEHFEQIGVLLRDELGQCASQVGEHLLVYVRRSSAASWLPHLAGSGHRCLIYGCDQHGQQGNLHFRRICGKQFITDLVTSKALITTAGNQLVGEALATGKPVLAIPEHGNFEQQINGFFLQRSGMGQCVEPKKFGAAILLNFLHDLDQYRQRIATYAAIGNEQVIRRVQSMLPNPTPIDLTLRSSFTKAIS